MPMTILSLPPKVQYWYAHARSALVIHFLVNEDHATRAICALQKMVVHNSAGTRTMDSDTKHVKAAREANVVQRILKNHGLLC
ncbi:hypothetical protein HJFPF1_07950 [Paramyrothecium foliicola]|nr:hypothetical protein HJFPF1_07950 [Paramyrothecium foliicola]